MHCIKTHNGLRWYSRTVAAAVSVKFTLSSGVEAIAAAHAAAPASTASSGSTAPSHRPVTDRPEGKNKERQENKQRCRFLGLGQFSREEEEIHAYKNQVAL